MGLAEPLAAASSSSFLWDYNGDVMFIQLNFVRGKADPVDELLSNRITSMVLYMELNAVLTPGMRFTNQSRGIFLI